MITINKNNYRINRKIDEVDSGMRHLTMIVRGDVRQFNNIDCDISMHDEEFKGVILMPHYCKEKNTTMFLLFVEE